uniref:Uncharacterized protein n=1 Tax=Oryza punctata TaxID=4537 RepID=A0A0E0KTD2_ORYPU
MLPGGEDGGKHRGATADEEAAATAASLNDLCVTAGDAGGLPALAPFPRVAVWAVAALLAVGLGLGALVLAVVHSAALLVVAVVLSAAVVAFLLWNAAASASGCALRRFVDGLPASSLRAAADGQLVKITVANPKNRCSKWKLTHAERFAADFYITDAKSGKRALVKAGHRSRVVPLIDENLLVTTSGNTELSSTLRCWLDERNIPSEESQLIRLEEGYIAEGMRLSVIGILSKKDGDLMILPPPEPISTGCVLLSFLLPTYFDGIILRLVDRSYFMPNSGVS